MKSYMNHLLRPPLPTILSLLIIASAVIYTGNFGLNNQLAAITTALPVSQQQQDYNTKATQFLNYINDRKALDDLSAKLAVARTQTALLLRS